ncbi:MAG: hypothetical protein RMJ28_05020 [Nitrososphaerota archaeon]|nr:hypothetical protein [Candidatus Calditenuaceae archaeon]MDW8073582.1 hypothetical protein [Nitrososphaerota archaeon]
MATKTRPVGITILAVLEIIGGIIGLLGAAVFLAFGALAGVVAGEGLGPLGGLFAALGGIVGGLLLVLALVSFLLAYGFWTGKGWAWILGIIFSIIGIVVGVVTIFGDLSGIVSIVINGLILFYLFRPNVKAWFGKA